MSVSTSSGVASSCRSEGCTRPAVWSPHACWHRRLPTNRYLHMVQNNPSMQCSTLLHVPARLHRVHRCNAQHCCMYQHVCTEFPVLNIVRRCWETLGDLTAPSNAMCCPRVIMHVQHPLFCHTDGKIATSSASPFCLPMLAHKPCSCACVAREGERWRDRYAEKDR